MIVRTANANAVYTIYNLGQNQILLAQAVVETGDDWDFAGPGAVNVDFTGKTLDLWVKRPAEMEIDNEPVAVNQFLVYHISGNAIKSYALVGDIGPDWQVQGFGFFFNSNFQAVLLADRPRPDMVTRRVVDDTAQYLAYKNGGSQFTDNELVAQVGANWVTAGLGTYNLGGSFAQLMVLNDGAGLMTAYAYRNGSLVNDPGDPEFANVGHDWEVLGFGHFSSQFGLNMLIRNVDPASANFQQVWIYDVVLREGDYFAQLSTAESPGQTQAGVLGAIGGNLTVAGFAPVAGSLGPFTDDMVMRDSATGELLLYSVREDELVPGAIGVPLTPPPSSPPIAQTSTIGGIAVDLSVPSSGSTSQLVQAMAGFGGSSGAADGSNAAPLSADTSQQTFLTPPPHV